MKISDGWESWLSKGQTKKKIGKIKMREIIRKQMDEKGRVICPYTGEILNPNQDSDEVKYPSIDHLVSNDDHSRVVITTRGFNDIKNNFTINELLVQLSLLKDRYEKGLIERDLLGERKKKGYGPKVKNAA